MDTTREIAHENWAEYFDWLSEELFNASVSIEIVASPEPPTVEAKDLALQTLAYDRRDDVFEVAVARGGPHLPSTVRHLVDRPQRVMVDSDLMLAPSKVAVDGADGVSTIITIKREAQFTG